MAFGVENAGINTEKDVREVLVPELEAAAKRVIDYAFQRLAEFAQKLGK